MVTMRRCLACDGTSLKAFADLGRQPLANSYHDGQTTLETYPLAVNVCTECWHSQLTHSVEPDLLFKNYLYLSGTGASYQEYFESFVKRVETDCKSSTKKQLRVLDIASNDGSLLARFAKRGHRVLGVDPAENLHPISENNGVQSLTGYWPAVASSIDPGFDAVIAMNVLAHVRDPLSFLQACADMVTDDGRIYIQTSLCEMIERGEFDTIYHEHHSYFTANSFKVLADRAGLTITNATKVPIAGTSYLWTLSKISEPYNPDGYVDTNGLKALQRYETMAGYYFMKTYDTFGKNVEKTAIFLQQVLAGYRSAGFKCVGYGAPARGNTLLNYANVDLDFTVEDNPLKVGLFTPGRNIPIVDSESLREIDEALCIVVLPWTFFDEIRDKVRYEYGRSRDVFIRCFPEPTVC